MVGIGNRPDPILHGCQQVPFDTLTVAYAPALGICTRVYIHPQVNSVIPQYIITNIHEEMAKNADSATMFWLSHRSVKPVGICYLLFKDLEYESSCVGHGDHTQLHQTAEEHTELELVTCAIVNSSWVAKTL